MENENEKSYFVRRRIGPSKRNRYYIDNELLEWDLGLTSKDIAVYNAIAKHANSKDQIAFPGYETIMHFSAVRNRRSLSGSLKKLEALNILKIEHSTGRKSNVYILGDPICWKRNGGKSATDALKQNNLEPYQMKQGNRIKVGRNNSSTVGTRSHTSKSEKLNHRNIKEMGERLKSQFSMK